jgi:antitoxin (DNA-binding transcriptional repressor) of toxin-antitoxin stability system
MEWIEADEEIRITRRGKPIARLIPEPVDAESRQVEWSHSPAVCREREKEGRLSARTAQKLIHKSAGRW